MPGGNDKVEVKAKAKIPAKMLKGKSPDASDGGGGGAPGGEAKANKLGDGLGLTIIFLGKHSNMGKRLK